MPRHGVRLKPHRRSDRLAEGHPPDERERYRLHNENGDDLDCEASGVATAGSLTRVAVYSRCERTFAFRYGNEQSLKVSPAERPAL